MGRISDYWENNINQWMQEHATGILGTVSFHLLLAVIFLIVRIQAEKALLESMIMLEFEEENEEEILQEETPEPELERLVAEYLDETRSNIPVNLARQITDDLSTEKYVDQIEEELESDRSQEYREMMERLRELEEISQEELLLEADQEAEDQSAEPFQGPTNIVYDLEFRYHLRLPVPVYQCMGGGIVEVRIAVDQQGRVVQAEVDRPGDDFNQICLTEAAREAALQTRFNSDPGAPVLQQGTITYHFIPQ